MLEEICKENNVHLRLLPEDAPFSGIWFKNVRCLYVKESLKNNEQWLEIIKRKGEVTA